MISSQAEAHRVAHKLRDPKFYTARTKRAEDKGEPPVSAEQRMRTRRARASAEAGS